MKTENQFSVRKIQLCLSIACFISAPFLNSSLGQEKRDETDIGFRYLGQIEPRHARDIASSDLAVGGEPLDRDLTDFDSWKEYLGPLGAKKIRLDLFLNIWLKRDRLTITDNILYYLLKSLRREMIKVSGKQMKQLDIDTGQLFKSSTFDVFQSSRESQIIDQESEERVKELVKKAINALPDRQREVLFLLYYEKLSFEEISSMMSIDLKTVYKLNWRGISQLKSVLSKSMLMYLLYSLPTILD